MNYVITGASGFIGKQLVQSLLAQGHTVNYLGRKRAADMDSRAAFFLWNTVDEPPLDCISRPDAIIHLAGEPVSQRWTPEVKERIRTSRIDSTRKLVSAIGKLKYKLSVLVSASAIGYYPDSGDRTITEETPAGTGFLAEICADWEREAQQASAFGVRVVTPRISVVLGASGGALPKMLEPFRFSLGGTLGSGKQWMAWIHEDDMVRLLQFCAENPGVSGPVNAASPNPVTNKTFTRELGAALHRPALFHIPLFALKLAFGEVAGQLMASLRVVPQAAQAHGFTFVHPDIREALRDCVAHTGTAGSPSSKAATAAHS